MKVLRYLSIAMLFGNKSYSYTNKRILSFNKNGLFMKNDFPENKLSLMYKPKTYNQIKYVNALNSKEDSITIVVGPAGTGKTLMACNSAIRYFKENKIDKIIVTRPVVSVEEDIGFLPGSLVKKMDPWTRPIFDIFEEYYSKAQVNNMILNGQIEISPLGFMRGRTFKNAFIIADEMQNSSPNQMYMLLTRIGSNSRMVITGDLEQSDRIDNNGLKDLMNKYKSVPDQKNIMLVELNKTDVQRSELVSQIINLYNKNVNNNLSNNNLVGDRFASNQLFNSKSNNTIIYNNIKTTIDAKLLTSITKHNTNTSNNTIQNYTEVKKDDDDDDHDKGFNDAALIPLKHYREVNNKNDDDKGINNTALKHDYRKTL